MLRALWLGVSLLSIGHVLPTQAIDGAMVSYGQGMNDTLIQHEDISGANYLALGLFWDSGYSFENDNLGYGEVEIETYFAQVQDQQTLNIVAVRPVINFWDSAEKKRPWYWQFGVGLSYFDRQQIGPVTLSSNGQFATIFGVGLALDSAQKHRLTLRYNHYSNGYLKKPNPGLDTFSLDWHIRF